MFNYKWLVASIIILSSLVVGCTKSTNNTKLISVKGSDTMVHLASELAEEFMNLNPNTDISVTGGGSGTGIAALLNGTTDICIASRKIKEKEMKKAASKNIIPIEIVVARDGIAVVVNPKNSISELSVEQIGKIYTGAYTNWKDVGGEDHKIIVLSRESSSGTYVFFQKRVMKKADYTQDALLMPATSSIIQSVSQDKYAIGYVGLGYATKAGTKVKSLVIKDKNDSKGISPSVETVKKDLYPIARPLHFYVNEKKLADVKKIVDFCLSQKGQEIVLNAGYVPVN